MFSSWARGFFPNVMGVPQWPLMSGDNNISPRQMVATGLVVVLLYLTFKKGTPRSLPVVNGRKLFEFSDGRARQRYRQNSKELLELGLKKSKVFYLNTDSGLIVIVTNDLVREVFNNPVLSVVKGVSAEFHSHIPGMQGFQPNYFPDYALGAFKKFFGRSLDLESIQKRMSLDTMAFLNEHWTANPEWHQLSLQKNVISMIAQLTAYTRSGKELSRNSQWCSLSGRYPYDIYIAAKDLETWPKPLHRLVHWALPSWRRLRADIAEGREVFNSTMLARKIESTNSEAINSNSLLEFLEEETRGRPFDACMAQMIAMHSMVTGVSELLIQVIFELSKRPELAENLRQEIVSILEGEGLTKSSLAKMHLMDSVIKESQRLMLRFAVSLRRYAEDTITLSDGTEIPKGSLVAVAMNHLQDKSKYPEPHNFQSDRFLKLRQLPGGEFGARLTSATEDHFGFGFGKHLCPGRFYAAFMTKQVLCNILLNYELRLVDRQHQAEMRRQLDTSESREAEIEVRRRSEIIASTS